MAVSVKVITDGPLMVKGECEVQDGQGNAMPPKGGDTIFLCRCGSSANRPLPWCAIALALSRFISPSEARIFSLLRN